MIFWSIGKREMGMYLNAFERGKFNERRLKNASQDFKGNFNNYHFCEFLVSSYIHTYSISNFFFKLKSPSCWGDGMRMVGMEFLLQVHNKGVRLNKK